MYNVQGVYNPYLNGEYSSEKAAEMLYNAMNGITRVIYNPRKRKFTLRNHIFAKSLPKLDNKRKKEKIEKDLELIATLGEEHPDIVLEVEVSKNFSTKHHNGKEKLRKLRVQKNT